MKTIDPVEEKIRSALIYANIGFVEEEDPRACRLDFYLPALDIHIEVKRYHTARIAEQMSRVPNVIAVQGMPAAIFVGRMIRAMNDPGMEE